MNEMNTLIKEAEKAVSKPIQSKQLSKPVKPDISRYPKRTMICVDCGSIGKAKNHVRGSFGMEIILWLFFIIPGLIYSIWRLTSIEKVCTVCKSSNIIPIRSPRGKQLIEQYGKDE